MKRYELKIKWSTDQIETMDFKNEEEAYTWFDDQRWYALRFNITGKIIRERWIEIEGE